MPWTPGCLILRRQPGCLPVLRQHAPPARQDTLDAGPLPSAAPLAGLPTLSTVPAHLPPRPPAPPTLAGGPAQSAKLASCCAASRATCPSCQHTPPANQDAGPPRSAPSPAGLPALSTVPAHLLQRQQPRPLRLARPSRPNPAWLSPPSAGVLMLMGLY